VRLVHRGRFLTGRCSVAGLGCPLSRRRARGQAPAQALGAGVGLERKRFNGLEDVSPVELDVGIAILDCANRVFVQRRAAHADAGGGSIPVENAGTDARAIVMNEDRRFVAALVACEPQKRHRVSRWC
jgi:hypothetical protein